MMKLLVKGSNTSGLAMHIADATGAPLCGNHLKLGDWHIEERASPLGVICWQCRRSNAAHSQHAARMNGSAAAAET
jgi:hypothetical protein